MPSIARPTKGVTCSCDDANAASRGLRRARRRTPCRQLPTVPPPRRELPGRRTGGDPAASVRRRARPTRRVALGVLVRFCGAWGRALLAGGGAVALHAAVGARVSRHDRDLRLVARAALLAVVRVRLRFPVVPLSLVFPVAWTAVEWAVGHQG